MQQTDSDLLRDYAGRASEAAFTELVTRHVGLVFSAAQRITVDRQLAEDVTQTTFAILAREARHLAGRTALASWLHRTASNQAAKLVRGEMRRRAREQKAYAMQAEPDDTEADWKQIAPQLDAALNRLTEGDRTVLLLRFFQRKSATEIGAALNVSDVAAQKRVTRALERLRGVLATSGVPVATAALASAVAAHAVITVPAGLSATVSASALAGGTVTAGLSLTTLKLILMSKLKIGAVSALIVTGLATPFILQQQNLALLRGENQSLRQQAQAADTLRAENEDLARRLMEAGSRPRLSPAELAELLRLRGEVGPLRRDSQELARLRIQELAKAPAPAPAAAAGGQSYVPAAAWANVGTGAPEAAIQTFLWAGRHGETNLIESLLRWQRDADIPTDGELDQTFAQGLVAGTTRFAGSLAGFRIVEMEPATASEARLRVELTDEAGKTQPHTLRLVREDGQWFPVMHVWLQQPGSVQASLEMPPKFATTP